MSALMNSTKTKKKYPKDTKEKGAQTGLNPSYQRDIFDTYFHIYIMPDLHDKGNYKKCL